MLRQASRSAPPCTGMLVATHGPTYRMKDKLRYARLEEPQETYHIHPDVPGRGCHYEDQDSQSAEETKGDVGNPRNAK
jgi:hypothetical protein